MTVKTTGAEFKRFYNDKTFWPDDAATGSETYHDDELIYVNGEEYSLDIDKIPDAATVKIDGGIVFNAKFGGEEPSFDGYFRRWKRKQNTVSFVVECDVCHAELVKKMVRLNGGKVL